jgi:hypothetical protein
VNKKLPSEEVAKRIGARGWQGTTRERLTPYCPNCYVKNCRRLWCWFVGAGFDFDPEELRHWNPNPDRMPGLDEFFIKRIAPLLLLLCLFFGVWWLLK